MAGVKNLKAYVFGSNVLDEEYAFSKTNYCIISLPQGAKLGMPRLF